MQQHMHKQKMLVFDTKMIFNIHVSGHVMSMEMGRNSRYFSQVSIYFKVSSIWFRSVSCLPLSTLPRKSYLAYQIETMVANSNGKRSVHGVKWKKYTESNETGTYTAVAFVQSAEQSYC